MRCSRAARLRSDSLSSTGTYAPMNTPFRLAIRCRCALLNVISSYCRGQLKRACKPNSVPSIRGAAIIHLGLQLPASSSDLPENAISPEKRKTGRATLLASSYLVLHHGEFTWPRMLPFPPVSSYLTVSPFTAEQSAAGLFSVALVVICQNGKCPDVIRPAALRCSDFPLLRRSGEKRLPSALHCTARSIIAKDVEH